MFPPVSSRHLNPGTALLLRLQSLRFPGLGGVCICLFWLLVFVNSFVSETGSGSHHVALAGLTGYVDPGSSEFMEILLLLSSECWHYRLCFVLLGHEFHYVA